MIDDVDDGVPPSHTWADIYRPDPTAPLAQRVPPDSSSSSLVGSDALTEATDPFCDCASLREAYGSGAKCDHCRICELVAALASERAITRRLREGLKPFAHFAERFDAKPLSKLGDEFYAIHTGTEWEASLRISDCRKARALLRDTAQEEK